VLAPRTHEPIGQQREDAFRQGLTMPERCLAAIQNRSQGEFVEQVSGDQNRSPARGLRRGNLVCADPGWRGRVKQTDQGVQVRGEEILVT
jgi:hypothetical protein